jgi:hypothetical protein
VARSIEKIREKRCLSIQNLLHSIKEMICRKIERKGGRRKRERESEGDSREGKSLQTEERDRKKAWNQRD